MGGEGQVCRRQGHRGRIMSDAKRIVGPWQADFDDLNGRCRAIYEERGVFPVCCFDPLLNHEYSAASGRLIAAAPEPVFRRQPVMKLVQDDLLSIYVGAFPVRNAPIQCTPPCAWPATR